MDMIPYSVQDCFCGIYPFFKNVFLLSLLIMGTKTMKTNDEKTNLSLNPNIKTKNLQKAKNKNMKCANKSAKKFLF